MPKIQDSRGFDNYLQQMRQNLDESWTSKLKPEIDEKNKTIKLQAPTRFIRDWIENNYQSYIEKAATINGFHLEEIKYGADKK